MVGNIGRLLILTLTLAPWLNAQERPVAFVDVTVAPMDKAEILPHQTVVVVGERIAQVGPFASVKVPRGALTIDGKGKFLMPGLADMHVHFIRPAITEKFQPSTPNDRSVSTRSPASVSNDYERENQALGLLFVANGITTVRNMWGDPAINTFAKEIDSGRALGPHIYSTGPITDGNPPEWGGSRVVETQSQAEEAVRRDKEAGYVALKVYSQLSVDAYNWLVSAARAQGLPVVGHMPFAVGLRGAIAAHQDSIEHLQRGFWAGLQPNNSVAPVTSAKLLVEGADLGKLPALVESIRSAHTWICPTLVLYQILPDDSERQGRIALVPPAILQRYGRMYPERDTVFTLRAYKLNISITRALHQGGAQLLLGTDATKSNVLPGFSLHEELQHFVEAALTPYEAIRAGTSDAAKFLHQENEFGVVKTGLRADLLLVEGNPLDDVKNVSNRAGVMVNGRWITQEALASKLAALKASYQH